MTQDARQNFPDEIRGIALLGILWVNVPYLATSAQGFDRAVHGTWADQSVEWVVAALFQTKFYLLFCFLFGYSAHLLLSRANGGRAFFARLIGLAALGVAHAVLFFAGDILLTYALLGLTLLFVHRLSDSAVLRATWIVGGVTVLWMALIAASPFLEPQTASYDLSPLTTFDLAAAQGGFWELAQARMALLPAYLVVISSLQWGYALAGFFLGLVAARHSVLAQPEQYASLWQTCRRLGWLGFPLTLIGAYWTAGPAAQGGFDQRPIELVGSVLVATVAPLVTAAYVGYMALLLARWPNALRMFRSAGRMSLTTYLMQSVLLCFVFCGWGLGLFGQLSNATNLAIALSAYVLMAWGAVGWLARFKQGPMEWVMKQWVRLLAPSDSKPRV